MADHDIAIIGGGVVGLALMRRFALSGLRTVLLERAADILSGASKGNSALLHTGFDATPGSLEQACVAAGYRLYREQHEKLGLPLLESGAVVAAWTSEQEEKLPSILDKAHANGVSDCALIDGTALRRREPQLAQHVRAGVLVPGEHIIDPWSAPLAYARQALDHGATLLRNAQVTAGEFHHGAWRLITGQGDIRARIVVNASGNYGDIVEAIARPTPFHVRPRKGQFVVFDKSAHGLLSAILLPVPTSRTKGVVVFRTIFGNLAVGPTAEDQDDRADASTDAQTLAKLIATGCEMVPTLATHAITATYAGLRPATEFSDYQIEALADRNWISVSGIRSTGLTGSLGIAEHVAGLYATHFGPINKMTPRLWTPVPNLAEHKPRPWQERTDEIICHCELVTKGEILAALEGPLAAGDRGGLKRRTRAGLGRCQGFYCAARVVELCRGRFPC